MAGSKRYSSRRQGRPSLSYSQHLAQCLTQSSYPENICWMKEESSSGSIMQCRSGLCQCSPTLNPSLDNWTLTLLWSENLLSGLGFLLSLEYPGLKFLLGPKSIIFFLDSKLFAFLRCCFSQITFGLSVCRLSNIYSFFPLSPTLLCIGFYSCSKAYLDHHRLLEAYTGVDVYNVEYAII